MLLAVDVGNTNTKFALFEGPNLIARSTAPTADIIEVSSVPEASRFTGEISDVVICSVVPQASAVLEHSLSDIYAVTPKLIPRDIPVPIESVYRPADSIGTDRLVNAAAAKAMYGSPCVVCSFGTASTFDAVDAKGIHVGGAIAPGADLGAKALHEFTASLPLIKPSFGYVIGNATDEAIRSGVFWGQISMAEGMISRFKMEVGSSAVVVATGGFASTIADHTTVFDHVDQDLTLKGIRLVHDAAQLSSQL